MSHKGSPFHGMEKLDPLTLPRKLQGSLGGKQDTHRKPAPQPVGSCGIQIHSVRLA